MALGGYGGSVAGANGVTEVREWTATETKDTEDTTHFGSNQFHEFTELLKGMSGSLVARGTRPTAGTTSVGGLTLKDNDSAPLLTIVGTAILSSIESSVAVDGVVEHSADFQFTGSFTITIA